MWVQFTSDDSAKHNGLSLRGGRERKSMVESLNTGFRTGDKVEQKSFWMPEEGLCEWTHL